MATKVAELSTPLAASRTCQPKAGGCCSLHRRGDRIYEDHVWRWGLAHVGERPWTGPPPERQK